MSNTDNNVQSAAETAAAKPADKKPAEKKKPGRFNKKNEISILLLSLALSFTVFFFSPMDIFLGNQREFVVNFKYVAIPMLLTALACTAALVLLQNLLLLIREWLYQGFARLLFGFLLAIYTQSLFLNSKMTSITGDDAHYNDDTAFVAKNIAILSVILLLPLILFIIAKIKPKNKVLNIGKGMILPYISGLIFFMHTAPAYALAYRLPENTKPPYPVIGYGGLSDPIPVLYQLPPSAGASGFLTSSSASFCFW